MKKLGLCVLSLLFVFTLVPFVNAGDVMSGNEADSAKAITLSGDVQMTALNRSGVINDILNYNETGPGSGNDKMDHDFVWVPLISINANIDVADKVSALIQLENQPLNGTGVAGNTSALGLDTTDI
ncbi:MAG: hypothetical protein KAI63_06665, partial [Planctomycetes bacterium]|nr:hypothetical protein [Planctomycetota bacterium]